jgi:hypothetical protein
MASFTAATALEAWIVAVVAHLSSVPSASVTVVEDAVGGSSSIMIVTTITPSTSTTTPWTMSATSTTTTTTAVGCRWVDGHIATTCGTAFVGIDRHHDHSSGELVVHRATHVVANL